MYVKVEDLTITNTVLARRQGTRDSFGMLKQTIFSLPWELSPQRVESLAESGGRLQLELPCFEGMSRANPKRKHSSHAQVTLLSSALLPSSTAFVLSLDSNMLFCRWKYSDCFVIEFSFILLDDCEDMILPVPLTFH
jgi:hypothetical protein